MFHALMGRFQLNQNFELPLFSVFTIVLFNCFVYSSRPFVAITISFAGIGCRGSYCRPILVLEHSCISSYCSDIIPYYIYIIRISLHLDGCHSYQLVSCIFLIAYSRVKLNSNADKLSSIGKIEYK